MYPVSARRNLSGTNGGVPAPKVLVAEDDSAIRELLAHHLKLAGYDVVCVGDGNTALRAARCLADVVVLDIGLPAIDGLDVVRALRREQHDTPVLLLTARTEEVDRIVGLELGADDYVCKPFSPREVVARVRTLARRRGISVQNTPAVLTFGRLEIDESAREVRIDGKDLRLKPREFGLLLALASNAGIALSRRMLLDRVWGADFAGDERTVDVHVRRVRAQIEINPGLPPLLHTVHGFGYKFARS